METFSQFFRLWGKKLIFVAEYSPMITPSMDIRSTSNIHATFLVSVNITVFLQGTKVNDDLEFVCFIGFGWSISGFIFEMRKKSFSLPISKCLNLIEIVL